MSEASRLVEKRNVLEKVGKLRDRFAVMGSALAVFAILAAVWVRAPTLEIELPLGAEGKAALNVGYVLTLGIPVISVVYAWAMGNLVTMRQYQYELMRSVERDAAVGPQDSQLLLLQLGAASWKIRAHRDWLDRIANAACDAVRGLILFVLPAAACLFIANVYYTALEIYPEHNLDTCASKPVGSECRRDVTLAEQFLGLTLARRIAKTPGPHPDDRYAIANGDIEQACDKEWGDGSREALTGAVSGPGQTGVKCVYNEFPRFVLPLTSYVNAAGTLLTIALGIFGAKAFWRLPKLR